jgi:hypothetical protein
VALRINGTLKYPAHGSRSALVETIDGLPNFFAATFTDDGHTQAQLESGINPMRQVGAGEWKHRPAVLIRSSPRKAGSLSTPWHDTYDMDGGRVRYFGDAKVRHMPDPRTSKNNILIEQFGFHSSPDSQQRLIASPLLFFVSDRPGEVEFRGFGLIESVELVSQIEPKTGAAFSNYAFDCALLRLADEGEEFKWNWISARKDPSISLEESLQKAPYSWQTWVSEGSEAVGRIRRIVAQVGLTSKEDQLPTPGSEEELVLKQVYDFYSSDGNNRKARFEALAEVVTEFVISKAQGRYQQGWITRGSGDHGIDFVGRLDIGSGFAQTSLVVLGQAKCEKLGSTTSGKDIARTVARLKRGWIGSYVTTGTFSASTQQEVAEDRYPLLLIPGGEVARAVRTLALQDGISIEDLLERVDERYPNRLRDRDPEQVLVL